MTVVTEPNCETHVRCAAAKGPDDVDFLRRLARSCPEKVKRTWREESIN